MKFVAIIFTILVIGVISSVSIGYWIERPVTLANPILMTVSPGDGTHEIAAKLDSSRVIMSPKVFRWLARWRGIDRDLHPGRYKFEGSLTVSNVLDILRDGRSVTVSVTIPEGWTIARIVPYLSAELGFHADSLRTLLGDPQLIAQVAPGGESLEGYLWPETYQFFWGVPPREVLRDLLNESSGRIRDSINALAPGLGMTRHQILTLASLIEAEAAEGAERGLISGVFHNRLRDGWLLQCDPTVVYAMGGLKPGQVLQKSDLTIDSPYNTYLYPGLPPGPICNPGWASIEAALRPDSTDSMYFVANGDGTHTFSRTLSQHNTARAKIKRELRRR